MKKIQICKTSEPKAHRLNFKCAYCRKPIPARANVYFCGAAKCQQVRAELSQTECKDLNTTFTTKGRRKDGVVKK